MTPHPLPIITPARSHGRIKPASRARVACLIALAVFWVAAAVATYLLLN